MSVKDESFLNKVYDSYIKDDYSYGDDNLNPKREVRKDGKKDVDTELRGILEKMKTKVEEISARYPSVSIVSPEIESNFGGSGDVGVVAPSLRLAVSRAGGEGTSMFGVEDMAQELEMMIGGVLPPLLQYLDDNKGKVDESDLPSLDGLDLYDINCLGATNIITGEEIDSGDGSDLDINGGNSTDNSSNDSSNDSDNSGGSGGDDSSEGGYNNDDGDTPETSDSLLSDASAKGLNKIQKDIANGKVDAVKCAIKDLSLLKAFLAILKIIQTIKKALQPALSIAVEVLKISVLAAQCWFNPIAATELKQRIIQKLMAIIIMIIITLLQLLWDMLGLDCISSMTKSILDEIRATMAGFDSIVSNFNALAVSLGSGVEKVKDAFDMAKSSIDDAMKNMDLENLKQQQIESIKDAFSKDNIKNSFEKEAISQATKTKQYNEIMSNINKVKSLQRAFKKTAAGLVKAQKGADATVQKIVSQFSDVEAT